MLLGSSAMKSLAVVLYIFALVSCSEALIAGKSLNLRALKTLQSSVPVDMSGVAANNKASNEMLRQQTTSVQSPTLTWKELEDSGYALTDLTSTSLFMRSLAAGIFVGFGGILTASVGYDMGAMPWETGQGLTRLIAGTIGFPMSFFLINLTGNGT